MPHTPPWLGAAYYPEDWPLEQIDDDIALMKDAGMNVMRVAEFAWSRMEPREDHYDFDWLHIVVDKLGEAGLATIMCTPTCTPPAWMVERYPEIMCQDAHGTPKRHGARRDACPNSPVYRDHCGRITRAMAEGFGDDENVIGWQIDNELSGYCYCPACQRKFQDAMRARYGTVEDLNEVWALHLWSQALQSFSQLPIPTDVHNFHPSLVQAWRDFWSDSYTEFTYHQADILHELVRQPVGTDMMPVHGVSYEKVHRELDLVQFNHYNTEDNLWYAGFWMDYCRQFKDVPFWNTETSTCWSGRTWARGYRAEGFCRANSWLPYLLGGEANLYWLWRSHRAGQELMHGSVVSSCGRPLHIFGEVKEVAEGIRKSADFINGTTCTDPGFGLHFSNAAGHMMGIQPMVEGFDYSTRLSEDCYRPLVRAHYRTDVIDPTVDLSKYRVIWSPFLPALDEAGLRERLHEWIENGGIWIAGPLSDIRKVDGTKFTHAPYGTLEDWAGITCKYEIPGAPVDFAVRWPDGSESNGDVWYDGIEPRDSEALATYTAGPLAGLAAVTRRTVGKGSVIALGTLPPHDVIVSLIGGLLSEAGITPVADASPDLLVVPREGEAGSGLMAVEVGGKPARLAFEGTMLNLLDDTEYTGEIALPPYGVAVLKR